jgi:peptidylprolyl isomerase
MAPAKSGDTVKVHYKGTLDDGTVFDSSLEREPLQFQLGAGQILPGFEKAVEGLTPGEKTTASIPAAEAYGERNDEAIIKVERAQLPEGLDPQVGQQLQMRHPNGQAMPVRVTEVSEVDVTIDANHPLAGKDLKFEIELVAVG